MKPIAPDFPLPRAGDAWYPAAAVLLALLLVAYPVFDLDLFWHLANGRAMVQAGHIVNSEAFSFTHRGQAFVNHAWLAELLTYRAWAAWGVAGLYAVKGIVAALAVGLLWRTVRATGLGAARALALVPLVVLAGLDRYHVRPELFSILGVATLATVLEAEKAGRARRWFLWTVPALFAAWDWTHGAIIGWAYLLVVVAGENLRRRIGRGRTAVPVRRLNLVLAITLAVGLLNPYGLRTYGHFLVLAGGVRGADRIVELQPLWDLPGGHPTFWVLLALVIALAAAVRRGLDLTDALLAAAFAAGALRYGRLVAVAAVVLGVVAAKVLVAAGREAGLPRRLARGATVAIVVTLVLAGGMTKFGDRLHVPAGDEAYRLPREERAGLGLDELRMPAASVRFVEATGLQGPLYNNGNLGGYLAYYLAPRQPIFQYNMPPVFGDTTRFVEEPSLLDRWDIAYAFAGSNGELTKLFPPDAWAWVFSDYVCTVVARRTPEHAALIRKFELQCFSPEQPRDAYRALAADPSRRARLAFEMGVYLAYARDARIAARWSRLLDRYPALRADPDVAGVFPAAAARNQLATAGR